MNIKTIIFGLSFLIASNNVQGNQYIKAHELIGKSIGEGELQTWMVDVYKNQYSDSYSTIDGIYTLKVPTEGFMLHFTKNFTLHSVFLYDTGYYYSQYKGLLPEGLTFSTLLDSFQFKYSGFASESLNPYVFTKKLDKSTISIYFKNGVLELVKIIGDQNKIKKADLENRKYWGFRILPSGTCESGDCVNGMGTMTWSDGLKYIGEWNEGICDGVGALLQKNDTLYVGDLKLGYFWGEGHLKFSDEYVYTGSFLLGKRNGKGSCDFANKTFYNGDWKNDQMHGKGSFYFSSNYYYIGQMRNNLISGSGKLVTKNGYFQGHFKNGKPHGFATQFVNSSKTSLEGNWVNGMKNGVFESYSPISGRTFMKFENNEIIK